MNPTNQNRSLWKRLQEKCNVFVIAMDYDPLQDLFERNRNLERELALLKANVNSQIKPQRI